VTSNLRLIHVVTRDFHDLQGLYRVLFGVVLLWLCGSSAMLRPDSMAGMYRQIVDFAPPMLLWWWASERLPQYYGARVGHVASRHSRLKRGILLPVWLLMWASHIPTRGAWSLLWIVWALVPVRPVWTGWPYRTHHLLMVAVSGYVAWSRLTAAAPWFQREHDMFTQAFLLAGAFIVTGLLDHIVLLRALPRTHPETVPEEA
jgi:hypothetical protein